MTNIGDEDAIVYSAAGEWELRCDVYLDGKAVASVDALGSTLSDAVHALDTELTRARTDGLPEYIEVVTS